MSKVFARLALAACVLSFAKAHAAPPPVEYFAELPKAKIVSLSPSGKYFATVQVVEGEDILAIFDSGLKQRISLIKSADPNKKTGAEPEKKTIIESVQWHSDDRIIVRGSIYKMRTFGGQKFFVPIPEDCSILVMNRDGSNPVPLACVASDTLSRKGPDADTILMQSQTFGRIAGSAFRTANKDTISVFEVNLRTGDVKLRESGNSRTVGWIADKDGVVRVRIDRIEGTLVYFTRASGAADWVETGSAPTRPWDRDDNPLRDFQPNGFGSQANEILITYTLNGRRAIGVFDLAQKKVVRTLFSDPKFDYSGLISDRDGNVVGAGIDRFKYEQEYIDPRYKAVQAEIRATFPGHHVIIRGLSNDLQRALVYVEGPQFAGGGFVFLDFEKGDGSTIVNLYPKLKPDDIGKTSVISYTTRDGKSIDAYLTVPAGSNGKNLPGIVMPHGGPHARDSGEFDYWASFLASRGYAVIRPQFRGSTGFGVEHLEAGRYQWGLRMQDDVTDAAKNMVATGVMDPKRMCIFGWSYGGYAAMAGATMTPELYRCVVAGAGVSDLIKILADETGQDSNNYAAQFWRRTIGNPGKDYAKLKATSPVYLADKVTAPVLLIHGDADPIVFPNQSEFFYRELQRLKKPVEYVVLKDETHYLQNQETRVQMMKALDGFLLKHNPPN